MLQKRLYVRYWFAQYFLSLFLCVESLHGNNDLVHIIIRDHFFGVVANRYVEIELLLCWALNVVLIVWFHHQIYLNRLLLWNSSECLWQLIHTALVFSNFESVWFHSGPFLFIWRKQMDVELPKNERDLIGVWYLIEVHAIYQALVYVHSSQISLLQFHE